MSVNKEVIDSIRANFLASVQQNSELYAKSDVERVESNDWWIERFVMTTKSEEAALKALIKAMQWRKTFGVNDFTDDYFPEEFYKICEYVSFNIDKENRPVLWWNMKKHHKSAELGLMVRQFLVYQYEKLDRQTSHEGWAVVGDSIGSGLSNVEMDFCNFMVDVLQSYYPKGPKYVLVVELPWILNATAKLVMAFMNEHLKQCVKFVKKAEMAQYIDPACIPFHMVGIYDKDLAVIPAGVKPLAQLTHTKFTSDQIKKIYSTFKSELK